MSGHYVCIDIPLSRQYHRVDNNGVEKIPQGALPKLCLAYVKISPRASIQTAYAFVYICMYVYGFNLFIYHSYF